MRSARVLRRATRLVSFCAAVGITHVLLPGPLARAANVQWVGTTGQWQTASNWSPHVPAASDDVFINPANAFYSVDYVPSAQPPASYVPPALGNVLLESTGSATSMMTLNLSYGYRLDAAATTVGQNGSGFLYQSKGALNLTNALTLGYFASGKGTYTLDGGTMAAGSMTVGLGGAGTFSQTGGQATVAGGGLVVGALNTGTFNLSGGTLTTPSLRVSTNPSGIGQVNHTGGTLNATNQLVLSPLPNSNATYKLSGSATLSTGVSVLGSNGAATFLQTGGTHQATYSLVLAEYPGSSATYALSGGLLSAQTVVLNPNSTLSQTGGTLRAGQIQQAQSQYAWTAGTLEFTGDLPVPSYAPLGGRSTLSAEHALVVDQTATLQVPLTLDGGSFTTGQLAASGAGALRFVRGNLAIVGPATPFVIGAAQPLGQTLSVPAGSSVSLGAGATIQFDSIVSVAGGGRFNTSDAQNDGLIELASPVSRFVASSLNNQPSGRLVTAGDATAETLNNSGEITLAGTAAALRSIAFTNSGLLHGRGSVFSTFVNDKYGEVQAETADRLRFLPSSNASNLNDPATNSGRLALLGGSLQFTAPSLVNTDTGVITGRGTLTANRIENAGDVHLSAGLSDVFAPLDNVKAGSVVVTGNATATFHGPVTIEKGTTFHVAAGSTAVFLAPVTADTQALVTGAGAKFFEGGPSSFGALVGGGSTAVAAAAVLVADRFLESALTVEGSVVLRRGAFSTSTLDTLTLANAATLDVTTNAVAVALGANAGLVDRLATAYDGGAWDGAGITSSAAAHDARHATTLGYAVDGQSLAIRYTWVGDTNLDGVVNAADRAALFAGLGKATGTATWADGDLNYDRSVNADDFALFTLGAAFGTANISTVVPEPSTPIALGVALLAAAGGIPVRRRGLPRFLLPFARRA
jgi:hypothetical protein